MKYNVIEKFTSINGEGLRSGQLTTFIRFFGCNLRCAYCDSAYSYDDNETYTVMSDYQILEYCRQSATKNITLAGGEPLYQEGITELVQLLCDNGFSVEIETNGAISIEQIAAITNNRPWITLDYKTSASKMEKHNLFSNYQYLTKKDCVKFVVGCVEDLDTAVRITDKYKLLENANVLLSPVYGQIAPVEIADYMKAHNLNGYRMQIQIHKVIWDAEARGV